MARSICNWAASFTLVATLALFSFSVNAAPQRGLSLTIQENGVEQAIPLYSNSYALVIGNDAYEDNAWPSLSGAVKDAEEIASELTGQGFEVTLLKNLTSRELKNQIEEFLILKGEDENSRIFVWYAGHGHNMGEEGYLVPIDAPDPNVGNGARFRLKALSLRRFGEYMRQANSRHVLTIFDSCFSGTVFDNARSKPPLVVNRAIGHKVRQFVSSGEANQTVSDNGRFRKLFLDAISGRDQRADMNGDGYVLGSELGLYLQQRMVSLSENKQTPRWGKLNARGYDLGDFVFKIKIEMEIPVGSEVEINTEGTSNTSQTDIMLQQLELLKQMQEQIKSQQEQISALNKDKQPDAQPEQAPKKNFLRDGNLASWKDAAARGDSNAEVALGIAHAFGYGVEPDEAKALQWFETAAAHDNPDGQLRAGIFHAWGYQTPSDWQKAISYFREAAANGNATAMLFLFDAYEDGRGVVADIEKAIYWMKKAAAHGHPVANYAMAEAHFSGEKEGDFVIAEKNVSKAITYLTEAAQGGHYMAAEELSKRYEEGRGVSKNVEFAEKWSKEARRLYQALGEDNDVGSNPACLSEDECYSPDGIQRPNSRNIEDGNAKTSSSNGNSPVPSWQRAEQKLIEDEPIAMGNAERTERLSQYNASVNDCDRLAAHSEDEDAVAPGTSYGDLDAVRAVEACRAAVEEKPQVRRFQTQLGRAYFKQGDFSSALTHLRKGAALGSGQSMAFLGVMYKTGKGVQLELPDALFWFERSADNGNLAGFVFAAGMHLNGEGTAKNPALAARLFATAADKGVSEAHYNLGILLDKGEGVARDAEAAAIHLLEAYYQDYRYANKLLLKTPDHISQQTRLHMQQVLRQKECYKGKLDGLIGEGTKRALKACKNLEQTNKGKSANESK